MKGKVQLLFAILLFLAVIAILMMRSQMSPSPVAAPVPNVTNSPLASKAPSLPVLEATVQRRSRMISTNGERSDEFKMSEQEIYMYVEAHRSNAVSLVTAFEASRDLEHLKRAATLFPTDPLVQAKVLMHNALPDERNKWIQAFKESSPTNSFPNLLAAREAFQRGDIPTASREFRSVDEKSFNDYTHESIQGLEEAYLSAGRSEAEAKTLASTEISWPHVVQLKYFGRQMTEAAAGNPDYQIELIRANWKIGAQFRDSPSNNSVLYELVGIAMQNLTYKTWPPNIPNPDFMVPIRIEADRIERKELNNSGPLFMKWFPTAPDQEIISYMDQSKMFGDIAAYQWLKERHPELLQK